ncbi:MAG: hypothetical protein WBF46_11180, partial [Candidatus Acidiferrales bacterium]
MLTGELVQLDVILAGSVGPETRRLPLASTLAGALAQLGLILAGSAGPETRHPLSESALVAVSVVAAGPVAPGFR